MKSQAKRVAAALALGLEVLEAVLADQLDAGLGERAHLLERRRTWSPPGSRPPGPQRSRTRSRLRAHHVGVDPADRLSHRRARPDEPALAPGAPAVAAVGEEELGLAARAQAAGLDLGRPRRARAGAGRPRRGRACARRRPRRRAARTPPGPRRRPRSSRARSRARSPRRPRRPPPPRARRSRRRARASRSGASPTPRSPASATGRQSATRTSGVSPGFGGHLAVALVRGGSSRRLRVTGSARGARSRRAISAPWTWRPIRTPLGVAAERAAQPRAVRAHGGRLVVGEQAEVEALERRLADPAEPGRERGPGARAARPRASAPRLARATPSRKARASTRPAPRRARSEARPRGVGASPSSFARSAARGRADRRALADAGGDQVLAGDLEPTWRHSPR